MKVAVSLKHFEVRATICQHMDEFGQLSKKEEYDLRRAAEKGQAVSGKNQRKMFKKLGLWASGFVVLGVLVFALTRLNGGGDASGGTASLLGTLLPRDRSEGNASSTVVLIEYSDFQCPACASYYPIVKRVVKDYKDRILFAYRHFPLGQHKNANLAARASEAAGKQGKFWEMHDMIFEKQTEWSESGDAKKLFTGYATSLGLNKETFLSDIDSPDIKSKVKDDYDGGFAAGVNATPTFFLNGMKLQNPSNEAGFRTLIDAAIAGNESR